MTKWNSGVWAGIFLFVFSVLFLFQSLSYPYASDIGPGPGFFPTWLSGLLLILSIFYIIESFLGKNATGEGWPKGKALRNIAYILVGLIAFVVLFYLFGFLVACIFFLFMMFYKAYKWFVNAALSIGVSIFLYWLFNNVLGVIIPLNGILL